jgi:translation initiation factor IF-2
LAKLRVHQLAKELGIPAKELLAKLKEEFDIDVKSVHSGLDEKQVLLVREYLAPQVVEKKEEEKEVEKEEEVVKEEVSAPEEEVQEVEEKEEKPVEEEKVEEEKKEEREVKPKRRSEVRILSPEELRRRRRKRRLKFRRKFREERKVEKPQREKEEKKPAQVQEVPPSKVEEKKEKPKSFEEIIAEKKREKEEFEDQKKFEEVLRKIEEKNRAKRKKRKKKKKEEAVVEEVPFEELSEEEQLQRLIEEEERQKTVYIPEVISVRELAERLGVEPNEVLKELITLGKLVAVNQVIDFETASKVVEKFGKVAKPEGTIEEPAVEEEEKEAEENLKPRPPIITVMGHVDHGKTTLLDYIRKTNVAQREAGGITQHIGASVVEVDTSEGRKTLVFLDTPGHEAFTAMRARGAQVTDIAVLVVAADDGVMPQTVEAINHAKAAGVPIIVAINKIDKPEANPERVKQELSQYGLIPEDWGGDTIMVPVSARTGEGVDELLEMIALQAELMELKANPDKPAQGVVLEAKLDKKRGPVATLLVQSGTLKVGDAIVAGLYAGKVRAMFNDKGKQVKEAGPSMPVEVLGLEGVPLAGDKFMVVEDEKTAKRIAEKRQEIARETSLEKEKKISLEDIFSKLQSGEVKELRVILKADAQGSIEAIRKSLEELSTDEVRVNILHAGVGPITENDVMLASASGAIVIGFNVRPDSTARKFAEEEGVDVRTYRVIYDIIDEVKKALQGLLAPKEREEILGTAEVRATFKISKVGTVAGCYVKEGVIRRNANVRLIRDGVVIYDGKIASLKRFKDDVKEVSAGYECGLALENFQDIKVGDVIECYTIVKEAQSNEGQDNR